MARADHAAIRFRRELHWPRRQHFYRPSAAPVPVPVQLDEAAAPGVTLRQALLIVATSLAAAALVTEGAIALVRWSIPL